MRVQLLSVFWQKKQQMQHNKQLSFHYVLGAAVLRRIMCFLEYWNKLLFSSWWLLFIANTQPQGNEK
jgi:hypothetical protein